MNIKDIAWIAGLVEGEGCLLLANHKYPQIQVTMTDEDVIRRAANIFVVATVYSYPPSRGRNKPTFHCAVNGVKALGWMMTIYSLMGNRRQAKIRDMMIFMINRPRTDWHEVGNRSWKTRQSRKIAQA